MEEQLQVGDVVRHTPGPGWGYVMFDCAVVSELYRGSTGDTYARVRYLTDFHPKPNAGNGWLPANLTRVAPEQIALILLGST